jgi:hypothetical protein
MARPRLLELVRAMIQLEKAVAPYLQKLKAEMDGA